MDNPYEVTAFKDTDTEVDIEALRIMRLPGMVMAIQGWTLTVLFSVGLVAISFLEFIFGEGRVFFEMGIPMAIALLMAIQLARCGMSTMRCKSTSKVGAGAVLSALLFLPLGIFVCLWVVCLLNREEVREASRKATAEG